MSHPLTALAARVTGAQMLHGDVRRLVLTTGPQGGTDWAMTIATDTALTVRQGQVRGDNAMVAVRGRVLNAIDHRPTLVLGIHDSGNRLVLTDSADPTLVDVDQAVLDAAQVQVDEAVALHKHDVRSPLTVMLASPYGGDQEALDVLALDPDANGPVLPALRASYAQGRRNGLWQGWITAEALRDHSGYHAANAMYDTLAHANAEVSRG